MNMKYLQKTRDLIGKTGFKNDDYHLLYSLHKSFDVIISQGLLTNDKFSITCDETMLRVYRIIPPLKTVNAIYDYDFSLWSQEHKVWFDISYSKNGQDITLLFKINRNKAPKKYVKEVSQPETLKEFGLNKWKD